MQNPNFGFFYQKMAASIVNLKWFRGVCVSMINSTTITKFENEITAPKRTVFFSELHDCWTTTNWHDRFEY